MPQAVSIAGKRKLYVKTTLGTALILLTPDSTSIRSLQDEIQRQHQRIFPEQGRVTCKRITTAPPEGEGYGLPDEYALADVLEDITCNVVAVLNKQQGDCNVLLQSPRTAADSATEISRGEQPVLSSGASKQQQLLSSAKQAHTTKSSQNASGATGVQEPSTAAKRRQSGSGTQPAFKKQRLEGDAGTAPSTEGPAEPLPNKTRSKDGTGAVSGAAGTSPSVPKAQPAKSQSTQRTAAGRQASSRKQPDDSHQLKRQHSMHPTLAPDSLVAFARQGHNGNDDRPFKRQAFGSTQMQSAPFGAARTSSHLPGGSARKAAERPSASVPWQGWKEKCGPGAPLGTHPTTKSAQHGASGRQTAARDAKLAPKGTSGKGPAAAASQPMASGSIRQTRSAANPAPKSTSGKGAAAAASQPAEYGSGRQTRSAAARKANSASKRLEASQKAASPEQEVPAADSAADEGAPREEDAPVPAAAKGSAKDGDRAEHMSGKKEVPAEPSESSSDDDETDAEEDDGEVVPGQPVAESADKDVRGKISPAEEAVAEEESSSGKGGVAAADDDETDAEGAEPKAPPPSVELPQAQMHVGRGSSSEEGSDDEGNLVATQHAAAPQDPASQTAPGTAGSRAGSEMPNAALGINAPRGFAARALGARADPTSDSDTTSDEEPDALPQPEQVNAPQPPVAEPAPLINTTQQAAEGASDPASVTATEGDSSEEESSEDGSSSDEEEVSQPQQAPAEAAAEAPAEAPAVSSPGEDEGESSGEESDSSDDKDEAGTLTGASVDSMGKSTPPATEEHQTKAGMKARNKESDEADASDEEDGDSDSEEDSSASESDEDPVVADKAEGCTISPRDPRIASKAVEETKNPGGEPTEESEEESEDESSSDGNDEGETEPKAETAKGKQTASLGTKPSEDSEEESEDESSSDSDVEGEAEPKAEAAKGKQSVPSDVAGPSQQVGTPAAAVGSAQAAAGKSSGKACRRGVLANMQANKVSPSGEEEEARRKRAVELMSQPGILSKLIRRKSAQLARARGIDLSKDNMDRPSTPTPSDARPSIPYIAAAAAEQAIKELAAPTNKQGKSKAKAPEAAEDLDPGKEAPEPGEEGAKVSAATEALAVVQKPLSQLPSKVKAFQKLMREAVRAQVNHDLAAAGERPRQAIYSGTLKPVWWPEGMNWESKQLETGRGAAEKIYHSMRQHLLGQS